jgi:flagellar secretion chaperone FliS
MYATAAPFSCAPRFAGVYREVDVMSRLGGDTSAHGLIAMLYDGLLEAIATARGALAAGQAEAKARAICRAARIVDEGLKSCLDLEHGGALATNLRDLYDYVAARLTHANLRNDDRALAECTALIEPLRSAWRQIDPGRP